MATPPDQTTWFASDTLLGVVLMAPICAVGGVGWGLFMLLFEGGHPLLWLVGGAFWAASLWFVLAMVMVIACRELSTHLPPQPPTTLPERLSKALQGLRYDVDRASPHHLVCKSTRWLNRLFSLEHTRIHVILHEDSTELRGPALLVKKVRKKLLAD